MLPLSVLMNDAFKTLPVGHQRVLWLLAAQYDGANNGDLSLTRKQAAAFGLNNERHRSQGLKILEERGLIEKAQQGGIASGGKSPTLWALTWRSVDFWEGSELNPKRLPSKAWLRWSEKQKQGTHVASSKTRRKLAEGPSHDTHVARREPDSPTRTLLAPSKNLEGVNALGREASIIRPRRRVREAC